jgi:L-fuconate dehydratase
MTRDSQLRWVGPEKGTVHLASSAIINAVWDLSAKKEKKPLWKLLADMTPEELVGCIDFSYITDMITPKEAV